MGSLSAEGLGVGVGGGVWGARFEPRGVWDHAILNEAILEWSLCKTPKCSLPWRNGVL